MYDPVTADKFLNSLFSGIVPHLDKIRQDCQGASELAIRYAETNDPKDRAAYQSLKTRLDTARKIGRAILEDPATGAITRDQVIKLFPELGPRNPPPIAPPTKAKAPFSTRTTTPAGQVTLADGTGEAPTDHNGSSMLGVPAIVEGQQNQAA